MDEKGWPFLEGPDLPLDGVSYRERQKLRTARIAAALRDGVPALDVADAWNLTLDATNKIASRNGISTAFNKALPLGLPVL